MNNKVKYVLLALGALFLIGVFTQDDESDTTTDTTPAQAAPVAEPKPEPAPEPELTKEEADAQLARIYEYSFMEGCMEDGSTDRAACQCMYDYMYDTYGLDGMTDLSTASDEEITNASVDAALSCI